MFKDKTRVKEYNAAYYARNREKAAVVNAAWMVDNLPRRREYEAEYRAANREKIADYMAEYNPRYYAAHRDQYNGYSSSRRARIRGSGGTHTSAEWQEKCALFANLCAYCGSDGPLVREHKTPIARGGTNSIDNVVPACSPCNARKGTKTASEFLSTSQEGR